MIILVSVIAIIAILVLLYVFVLIRPCKKHQEAKVLNCHYAHRGLHSDTVPENSLLAFELAVKNGYGMELDLQLSKDGEVMVFHDYNTVRMTGVDKMVCDQTADELQSLKLKNTDQTIPTFRQVLSLVDGKTPLLIELKGQTVDKKLCPKVAEVLKNYKGEYCIESFNPLLLAETKKHIPHALRGQLYTNACRDRKKTTPINVLLTLMAFNFLAKPNFIAYNKKDKNTLPVKITTKMYGVRSFIWTTKTKEEFDSAKLNGTGVIFENI